MIPDHYLPIAVDTLITLQTYRLSKNFDHYASAACSHCGIREDVCIGQSAENLSYAFKRAAVVSVLRELSRRGCAHAPKPEKPS